MPTTRPGSVLTARGLLWVVRGLRTGSQGTFLFGAAVAGFGMWRRYAGPKRELVHRERLAPGRALVVRERRGRQARTPLVVRADPEG